MNEELERTEFTRAFCKKFKLLVHRFSVDHHKGHSFLRLCLPSPHLPSPPTKCVQVTCHKKYNTHTVVK